MAAQYDDLGLNSNLYRKEKSDGLQGLTAADLEVLIADSELLTSKVGSLSTGKLTGGVLGQKESLVVTDGQYRRVLFGFIREEA